MTTALKRMTAAECSSERSRHRVAIGHLALASMAPGLTDYEKRSIRERIIKARRRIVRLERRIAIANS